ncbi:MAG: hypothetical protein M1822_005052 [Bathelium mastoideum]|nr:MAG: hypothetical protein M1822_005052 [Bathelium mastoideum]
MPSLKRLTVFGLGLSRGGFPRASAEGNHEPSPVLMPAASSFQRQFCSNIESLDFNDPSCGPALTEFLLNWPMRLRHLSLSLDRRHVDEHLWNIASIQILLDYQRHSLQDIELSLMPHAKGIPNFSQFPELTVLSLDTENLFAETPRSGFSKLSAPNLCRLTVKDSSPYDTSGNYYYTDFVADACKWLQKFAQHVSNSRSGPQNENTTTCSLKDIHIEIELDTWGGLDLYDLKAASEAEAREMKIWPWHSIEETATMLASHGINLSYEAPRYTREYWDAI